MVKYKYEKIMELCTISALYTYVHLKFLCKNWGAHIKSYLG